MFAAIHKNLQRWYEEGKVPVEEIENEDGDNEMVSSINRQMRSKRANDMYEEEEEQEDMCGQEYKEEHDQ